jgi:hypothetical protein
MDNVETLSRYENGHATPPDRIVADMAILYRNKKLITWHLRRVHPDLAESIPYPDDVHNIHEATLQMEFYADSACEITDQLKEYLRDGKLCEDDIIQLKEKDIPAIKRILDGLTAVLAFVEKI